MLRIGVLMAAIMWVFMPDSVQAQQTSVATSARRPVVKSDCVLAAAKSNKVPEEYLLAIELASSDPGMKQYSCAAYEEDAKRLAESLARTNGDFARAAAHFNGGEAGLRKYDSTQSKH